MEKVYDMQNNQIDDDELVQICGGGKFFSQMKDMFGSVNSGSYDAFGGSENGGEGNDDVH